MPGLNPEPLQRATEPIGQCAVSVEIDLVAERCLAFHAFTRDTDRCASTCELFLPLAQEIGTAQVIGDLAQHVTPPARPRATLVCFDEQRLAVRHPAALLARTTLNHGSISGRICGCFHAD